MQAIKKIENVDKSAFDEISSESDKPEKTLQQKLDDIDAAAERTKKMVADLDKKFDAFNQAYHDMNRMYIAKFERELGGFNAQGNELKNKIIKGNK